MGDEIRNETYSEKRAGKDLGSTLGILCSVSLPLLEIGRG